MSGFSSIAMPGRTPTVGPGASAVTPDALFKSREERSAYQNLVDGSVASKGINVGKVKVEIFDLSDAKQVRKYEKLWKSLLERASRMEVAVDHRKDLVHRPDGTSYWMKYIEYVEFSEDSASK